MLAEGQKAAGARVAHVKHKHGGLGAWRKGTDSLWKHRVKSSTCHMGHEQLAKPAMLPSSCGEEPTCSTQLLEGLPRHKAGDAVASVAKSVEGGLGPRISRLARGWICTAWPSSTAAVNLRGSGGGGGGGGRVEKNNNREYSGGTGKEAR